VRPVRTTRDASRPVSTQTADRVRVTYWGWPMSDNSESDTVEDMPVLPAGAASGGSAFDVDFGGRTHPGKVRPDNQDHFHMVQFGRYLRTVGSSLPEGEAREEVGPPGHGFLVADGVGGRAGGETASRLAIGLLVEFALQTPDWILGGDDRLLATVMDRFALRFRAVNFAVLTRAAGDPGLQGMGTTLSVAVTRGNDLLVTHLGDSRVYLLRREQLHRLTRDHTATRPVTEPGSDAIRYRRVLTRAIGLPEPAGEPDLFHYRLEDGDRLLLCTDGLTDMTDDWTIGRELGRAATADDACRSLVDLALGRGGRDNVTAVVAFFRTANPPVPPPA
jgi:PPM family protein phosphatase